jgi:ferrous iron transport protein B
LIMAWLFKKTLLKGPTPMLIMELPPYKRPLVRVVLRHMWDRAKSFLYQAGTVILGINILLWFLASYPRNEAASQRLDEQRAVLRTQLAAAESTEQASALRAQLVAVDHEETGARLLNSFAGRIGRIIEPVIAPLGFDWKMGIGIVASFAAREVFVSTMSLVYNVGEMDESEAGAKRLKQVFQEQRRADGTPVYTALTGLTLMIFYVFALQCASTVVVVRRETGSWKWPLFQWFYMGALAWGLAFLTYRGGLWLGLS